MSETQKEVRYLWVSVPANNISMLNTQGQDSVDESVLGFFMNCSLSMIVDDESGSVLQRL